MLRTFTVFAVPAPAQAQFCIVISSYLERLHHISANYIYIKYLPILQKIIETKSRAFIKKKK